MERVVSALVIVTVLGCTPYTRCIGAGVVATGLSAFGMPWLPPSSTSYEQMGRRATAPRTNSLVAAAHQQHSRQDAALGWLWILTDQTSSCGNNAPCEHRYGAAPVKAVAWTRRAA